MIILNRNNKDIFRLNPKKRTPGVDVSLLWRRNYGTKELKQISLSIHT